MKKRILIGFIINLFILSFLSCKKESTKSNITSEKIINDKYKELYGNWVGDFVADSTQGKNEDFVYINKINVLIKKIINNKVFGQSIVSGNSRPLVGTLVEKDNKLTFELFEPGDNKYDGKFQFNIINNEIIGKWYSNDKKAIVLSRKFNLIKQKFKYNPNLMLPNDGEYVDYYSQKIDSTKEVIDGVEETYYDELYRSASEIITKLNASTKILTESDLKNLKKLELEIIRNTIYARHGYTFKKKSYRQFFDPIDWYIPISDNVSAELTSIEKQNILLLNRFEKYAEDNYDTFGR